MLFNEIFPLMKTGAKAKLPHWAGYWEWDPERQTILMHCRPEESDTGADVLDVRESQRVEYTLQNILSDKWIFAFKSNTPILGGRAYMDCGDAFRMAKKYKKKIARNAWKHGEYVKVVIADEGYLEVAHLTLTLFNGTVINWIPSWEDIFAEDWYVVE